MKVGLVVLAVLLVAMAPRMASAAGSPKPADPLAISFAPGASSYTVQDGDTLLAIATRFGIAAGERDSWIASVVSLNALASPDQLTAGAALKLPDGTTTLPAGPTAVSTPASYIVLDGDTLSGIAQKLGIALDKQPDWISVVTGANGMASADEITPGQVLNLPGTATPTFQAISTVTPTGTASDAGPATYEVKAGDDLLSIAARLNVPPDQRRSWVDAVAAANGIDADHLMAGQVLNLPPLLQAAAPAVPPPPPAAVPPPPLPAPAAPVIPASVSASTAPVAGELPGMATPYADSLKGNFMGCPGAGKYDPADATVVAVGPALYGVIPCGMKLEVCSATGCLIAYRKDACPGCGGYSLDLSRSAFKALCPSGNTCAIRTKPAK